MFDFVKGDSEKPKKDTFSIKAPINKVLKKENRIKKNRWVSASKAYDYSVEEFVYGYFIGNKEVLELDDHFLMNTGTVIHEILQSSLALSGALIPGTAEKSFFCRTYGFAGAIDGVVKAKELLPKKSLKDPEEIMHFEIKSCTDHAYQNIIFETDIPLRHRMQAEIYQSFLGVKKTLFCYVSRCSFSMRCLVYNGTGELYTEACSKANQIWKHIGNRTLPTYSLIEKEEWDLKVADVEVPLSPSEIQVDESKTTVRN
jgi:hypothetical protein